MQTERTRKAQLNIVPISRQAASEGIVLLENKDHTLPLKQGEKVSLFGRCQIDYYRSGTGSGGAVNVPYSVNAVEGLRQNPLIELNEALVSVYQSWIDQHPFDYGGGGWAAEPWYQQEMPVSEALVVAAREQSDKAIIIIGRTAGEDQDNADAAGSYQLTADEINMLEQVCAVFQQVIVVLNVNNIIDMSWLHRIRGHESIKSVLYSWAAGMEGGHALADVLSGQVTPSGRLTDTIAHRLSDYPSASDFGSREANHYVEDIYVGYRYFETFKPEAVQYEFGAGLSYTEFSRRLLSHSVTGTGIEQRISLVVEVENLGKTYAAKEVIQIYVEAPQGLLGQPARKLVAFAKTDLLEPAAKQTLQLQIPFAQLASFDDSGVTGHAHAWVVESGCYRFYLGGSVRQAVLQFDIQIDNQLLVETLQEALAPTKQFQRMKPAARLANGVYEIGYQPVPQQSVDMAARIQAQMPQEISFSGDQGIRLEDVKVGRASIESFIAQLNPGQLATLVRGEGMCSPKVSPGTAAAFGGVSDALFQFGIPVAAAADGPSGIRMDSGHKATQVPIGTLLACTWNLDLNRKLFQLIGEELQANEIDTLLGPGINIHRHPLNGRNFEYFSEDPLVTGLIACAQTLGLDGAGVAATIKHFAANDQETARTQVDSVVPQRALREIHLKPFEMAVKQGKTRSIMTSYNPVNGHWAASNYDLNTTILRGEWGYQGIVMTDWWAKMNDPVTAGDASNQFTSFMLRAQNDLYMVVEHDGAESNMMADDTLTALERGTLTLGELQRSAMNICRFIMQAPVMDRPLQAYQAIQDYEPTDAMPARTTYHIDQELNLQAGQDSELQLKVVEPGVYQCFARASYDRNSQAQSTVSLSLNQQFSMSLSVNGTEGKAHEVHGLSVRLQAGYYQLKLDFVKPGMVIESLWFVRQ